MSAHHRASSPAPAISNQFIRPRCSLTHIDTASAAERLALKGAGFATSNEVAAAMREGVAAELADAVMVALGSRFECLSDADVHVLADLYTAAPSAATTTANAVVEPEGPKFSPSESMAHHIHPQRQVVTKPPDLPQPALLLCTGRKVPSPLRRMTRL